MFAHGETITRLRGVPATDRFSGEVVTLDWTSPARQDITGCGFDPGTSVESLEVARDTVNTQPTVYAPSGADVTALDRVIVRGREWQVDGDPAEYVNPFTGWAAGLVIKLKAVTG